MKKTLIALTIATLTATAANAAILYQKDGSKVSLYGSARILLAKQQSARTDLLNDQVLIQSWELFIFLLLKQHVIKTNFKSR